MRLETNGDGRLVIYEVVRGVPCNYLHNPDPTDIGDCDTETLFYAPTLVEAMKELQLPPDEYTTTVKPDEPKEYVFVHTAKPLNSFVYFIFPVTVHPTQELRLRLDVMQLERQIQNMINTVRFARSRLVASDPDECATILSRILGEGEK